MKGEIQPNHIPVNKFSLRVVGLLEFTAITISGIEDELETVELPDRTQASGGNRKAGEFEITLPMHHAEEQAAMEVWFQEGQDPVLPTYKKPCTLVHNAIGAEGGRSFSLIGVFVSKRTLPDLDKKDEGAMAETTWTMKYDDILPI